MKSIVTLVVSASVFVSVYSIPVPETPVANSYPTYFDPNPVSTYGAHPFHSTEEEEHPAAYSPEEPPHDSHGQYSRRGNSASYHRPTSEYDAHYGKSR